MNKTDKVNILSTIILVGFAFGVFYHYILGFYMHLGEDFNSFLYPSSMAFCDFTGIVNFAKHLTPYHKVALWGCYFPLAYIFLFPFSLIKNFWVAYSLYLSPFVIYIIFMNSKFFNCENLSKLQNFQNTFIISFLSYPVLYILDKGNLDCILFILMGIFTYALINKKYLTAAILLGIANAFKPFTIFFLIFFLLRKKYFNFFISIFITAALVIGGFMFLKDPMPMQILNFSKDLLSFKYVYALGNQMGLGYCSSIFMPLKIIFLHFTTNVQNMCAFVKLYDYSTYLITAIAVVFAWREKLLWKQLTLLICNFLLTPYCTYDYKLIFLFIPLWLFVNEKTKSKFDLIYTLLFASLFIPKNILLNLPLIKNDFWNWTTFSVIINPVILTILSLIIIVEQFKSKKGTTEELDA